MEVFECQIVLLIQMYLVVRERWGDSDPSDFCWFKFHHMHCIAAMHKEIEL